MRRLGKFLIALVAGYATMVVLLVISQDVLFGGVSYYSTPKPELVVAGILCVVSALAGGAVAARVFGSPHFPPVLLICGVVVLETIYLTSAGRLEGPLWFDAAASASLVVGLLVGAYAVRRVAARHQDGVDRR